MESRTPIWSTLVLTILTVSSALRANTDIPTVWLDSAFEEVVLDTFAILREDPSTPSDFANTVPKADYDARRSRAPIVRGYSPDRIGITFRLGVRGFAKGNPVLRLDNTVLDTIVLLLPGSGGFERITAGRAVRFDSRRLDDRRPAFELPLDRFKGSPKPVHLRLAGTDVMTVSLKLFSPSAYARKIQGEGLALGVYYGVIFVMIILNCFILAAFRDITHLLYIFLVASLGMFHSTVNGIAFQYLWPSLPAWNTMSVGFTCGLLILSGTAFSLRFLNAREYFPRIAGFQLGLYAPPAVLTVLSSLGFSSVTGPAGSILALLYVAFFAALSFATLKAGFRPARYYIAAGTAFFTGVVLDSLWNFGLVPTAFLTVHGNQLGSASGIVLLSLALTARFRQIELDRKEAQKRVVEGLRRTMEYKHKALQAQIRPHFLFNVLNTISGLITEDPERAEALITKLSRLFRYTLSASDRTSVGLDEEIQIVRSYLEIEQIRYGSRLKYSVNVEGPAARAKIPGLIIQPLVENSIKHGIRSKVEGGSVTVSVVVDDHVCRICVRDTGVGFSKGNASDGLGHGMRSIQERLELAFPKRWTMDIQSNNGTQIDIEFPMEVRTCVIAR